MKCLLSTLVLVLLCQPLVGFHVVVLRPSQYRRPRTTHLDAKNGPEETDKKNGGNWLSNYKFGDLTRSVVKKATSSINDLTEKGKYEFGDLTRFLDQKAKRAVTNLTEKEEYEFGDLSRWADAQVKAKLNNFTGKEDYQVGDVTKEIIRRVSSGEYSLQDIILLCKVLLSFGVGLTPIAGALPAKLLIEMINFSLAEEVGSRLLGVLASTLDQRVKEAITGDANYQVGDVTKRAILQFIGKEKYEFGDISKAVSSKIEGKSTPKIIGVAERSTGGTEDIVMDPKLLAELESWDRALDIASNNKNQQS